MPELTKELKIALFFQLQSSENSIEFQKNNCKMDKEEL